MVKVSVIVPVYNTEKFLSDSLDSIINQTLKDIEIILSPTNRLEDVKEKYAKASPIYTYLVPDREDNIIKHTTFLNMLKKVKIEVYKNTNVIKKILVNI